MFSSLSLKIFIGILILYLSIRLYRFRLYINTYLIPYEVNIVSDEIESDGQNLSFVVRFGQGFFKRKYFTAIGNLVALNPLSQSDLKNMLMLTESSKFNSSSDNIIHDYYFVQSDNPNGTKDYCVKYQIIEDSVIDKIRQSSNK